MMSCDTGEVNFREMWLKCQLQNKSWGRAKDLTVLDVGDVYRVKARKMRDDLVSPEELQSWALIDVLESDVSCPSLEAC